MAVSNTEATGRSNEKKGEGSRARSTQRRVFVHVPPGGAYYKDVSLIAVDPLATLYNKPRWEKLEEDIQGRDWPASPLLGPDDKNVVEIGDRGAYVRIITEEEDGKPVTRWVADDSSQKKGKSLRRT